MINTDTGVSQDLGKKADPAEQAFTSFLNSPIDYDDPYWQLFECKDIMNTFLLRAVEYGYKKGYDQANQEPSSFIKFRMNKLEPFISKIGGWSNFIGYVEDQFKKENIK